MQGGAGAEGLRAIAPARATRDVSDGAPLPSSSVVANLNRQRSAALDGGNACAWPPLPSSGSKRPLLSQCRMRLLEHKIALITKQVGSVVILEGLPGSGKTEMLSVFTARTLPHTAPIQFTAASPFQAKQRFGGWSMVLQQYLDSLCNQEVSLPVACAFP